MCLGYFVLSNLGTGANKLAAASERSVWVAGLPLLLTLLMMLTTRITVLLMMLHHSFL